MGTSDKGPGLDLTAGRYLVARGPGISRVVGVSEGDGAGPGRVDFEAVRFTGHVVGGLVSVARGDSFSLPADPPPTDRLREMMAPGDFLELLRHSASGETEAITRRELLMPSFVVDLFDVRHGLRPLVVLHDYVFHNYLDRKPSCGEYADLYRHAINSAAFEVNATGGEDYYLVREALEVALFVGHQMRGCRSCEVRDPEVVYEAAAYSYAARDWIYDMVLDGHLSRRPEVLDHAPVFLSPAALERGDARQQPRVQVIPLAGRPA